MPVLGLKDDGAGARMLLLRFDLIRILASKRKKLRFLIDILIFHWYFANNSYSLDDLALDEFKKQADALKQDMMKTVIAEKSYLSDQHHAECVERRWGGCTHLSVEEVKKKISDLLREYVENDDTTEACRCIREIGLSFYHHEVVKSALVLAMEINTSEPLIVILLKEAYDEGLISSSQMVEGFIRLALSMDDLALDEFKKQADAMKQADQLIKDMKKVHVIGFWWYWY